MFRHLIPLRLAAIALGLAAPAALALPPASAATGRVTLSAPAVTVPTGRTTATVAVRVKNTGKTTIRGLRVTTTAPKGLTRSPTTLRSAKALARGKSRTLRVKVTLKGDGPATLRLTAKASGTRTAKLAVKVARAAKGPLVGRAFMGIQTVGGSPEITGNVFFLDDEWAFVGVAKDPPVCKAVSENCMRYTFDPKTKALTFGSVKTELALNHGTEQIFFPGSGGLDSFLAYAAYVPPADAHLELNFQATSGDVGCTSSCESGTSYYAFKTDGTFQTTATVVTPDGAPVLPVNGGTYRFDGRGSVALKYAGGSTINTVLITFLNKDGTPDFSGIQLGNSLLFDFSK